MQLALSTFAALATARGRAGARPFFREVLGRNFFAEVAPCTNNPLLAKRLLNGPEHGALLSCVFTQRMKHWLDEARAGTVLASSAKA